MNSPEEFVIGVMVGVLFVCAVLLLRYLHLLEKSHEPKHQPSATDLIHAWRAETAWSAKQAKH
jgi:hypothetical protein